VRRQACLPPVETRAAIEVTVLGFIWSGEAKTKSSLKERQKKRIRDNRGARRDRRSSQTRPPRPRTGALAGGILILALVGGLILNGMPCVLPILSLKVSGW
jgi:thiol:disulfide interchange protein